MKYTNIAFDSCNALTDLKMNKKSTLIVKKTGYCNSLMCCVKVVCHEFLDFWGKNQILPLLAYILLDKLLLIFKH